MIWQVHRFLPQQKNRTEYWNWGYTGRSRKACTVGLQTRCVDPNAESNHGPAGKCMSSSNVAHQGHDRPAAVWPPRSPPLASCLRRGPQHCGEAWLAPQLCSHGWLLHSSLLKASCHPRFGNNPSLNLRTSGAWPKITSHLAHPTLTLRTGRSHWSHHLVPALLLFRKLRLYLSHCGWNPTAGCLCTCTSARASSHPTADPL